MSKPRILVIGIGDIGYPLTLSIARLEVGTMFATRQNNTKSFGELKDCCICGYSNIAYVKTADIIICAVRPSQLQDVLMEIKPYLKKHQILVSIIASKTIKFIKSIVGNDIQIVRAMPNIGISSNKSMTLINFDQNVEIVNQKFILDIFSHLGKVEIIPEHLMNAATIFSGSMPAIMAYLHSQCPHENDAKDYFVKFVNVTLTEVAREYGFTKAQLIITQVYHGLKHITKTEGKTYLQVIDQVATHGGCTRAILDGMQNEIEMTEEIPEEEIQKEFKNYVKRNIEIGINRLNQMSSSAV